MLTGMARLTRPRAAKRIAFGAILACVALSSATATAAHADATTCLALNPADVRCWAYPWLDASDAAAVDASAQDIASMPLGPAFQNADSGGPEPSDPIGDPIVSPTPTGLGNWLAPLSSQVLQMSNAWAGNLGGHFMQVWVGASALQPTMGEVLVETRAAEDGPVLESKLMTASATSGALTLTGISSTVVNALAIVATDGTQWLLNVVTGVLGAA